MSAFRLAALESNRPTAIRRLFALAELVESAFRGAQELQQELLSAPVAAIPSPLPPPPVTVLSMTDDDLNALADEVGGLVQRHIVKKFICHEEVRRNA